MITKPLVFVSSTSRLAEERRELLNRLPRIYELYLFELDRARRASPEAHCREMIEKSDVFLGILGLDYGSPFPDTGERRSIVEWEFEQASAHERLEILAFIKEPGSGQARDPAQQTFVDRVARFREGFWCQQFSTAAELSEKARASLEQWLAECWTRSRIRWAPFQKSATKALTGIAALILTALIAVSFSFTNFPQSIMIPLCACAASAVAICGVLIFRETGGSHG